LLTSNQIMVLKDSASNNQFLFYVNALCNTLNQIWHNIIIILFFGGIYTFSFSSKRTVC